MTAPAMRRVASAEGIAICPETAVCFDCLERLVQEGKVKRDDEIVIFNPLGKEQLERIVDLLLKSVAKLLAERQITLELTPAAKELQLREGYDPAYGARPLRRTIQRLIQDPLALQILEGKVLPGDHVRVDREDAMRFERKPAKKPATAAGT